LQPGASFANDGSSVPIEERMRETERMWTRRDAKILAVVIAVAGLIGAVIAVSTAATALGQTAWQRGLPWYQTHTGIEAGHTLTLHTGDWTLTSADNGKTFQNINVTGSIVTTAASNVTFTDVKAYRVVNAEGGAGMTFTHCELDGSSLPNSDSVDNQATDGTYQFCNIHGGFRGIQWSKFVNEQDNWLHDFRELTSGTHRCTTATNGMSPGGSAVIQRSWLEAGQWGAELSGENCMYGDFAQVHDVTVTGDVLVDSGSYQIYGGSCSGKTFPHASNVHVVNNVYGPSPVSGPPGAQYGHLACWEGGVNGNAEYSNQAVPVGQNPDTYTGALIAVP
jgi:hypothetical protein